MLFHNKMSVCHDAICEMGGSAGSPLWFLISFFQEEKCHFLSLFKIFYCAHRAYELIPTLVSVIYISPSMAI